MASEREIEDNPEWTADDFARAQPAEIVHSPDVVAQLVRPAHRPAMAPETRKERISIRLSPEVLRHFRGAGAGWQSRIDAALREIVTRKAR